MRTDRPVNLDLTKFHFPPMAIVSIFHRMSGLILFVCMPLIFYLLHQATSSKASFLNLKQLFMHNRLLKAIAWIIVSATLFHLFSGIRHLIMDFGFWESAHIGRNTAYVVFIVSLITIALVGVWIW